jgi:hypothetical protein
LSMGVAPSSGMAGEGPAHPGETFKRRKRHGAPGVRTGAKWGDKIPAKVDFEGLSVEEQALYIIDNYADIFLDNLGLGLNRRRILSIMYETRKHLMRQWRFPELVKVLSFLQETFHQELEVEIGIFNFLRPMGREEAEATAALKAEQHFEMGNYRLALVYYQLLEDESGEGPVSERVQECLARIDNG